MGEERNEGLRLDFDQRIRMQFVGSKITSDAGLLADRELDEKLGLTSMAAGYLTDTRTGKNIRHHLVPCLRQSVYSRLAGYPDTNDADRLARDPAMRAVVSRRASSKKAAARREPGTTATSNASVFTTCSVSTSMETVKERCSVRGMSHQQTVGRSCF